MNEDVFHLGIKALIRNDEGKALLLRVNAKELVGVAEAYWDIPGGRIKRGDTVEDTLRREVAEETGLAITACSPLAMVRSNIRIPRGGAEDVGLILAVYECRVAAADVITLSSEHVAYEWVASGEAAARLAVKYPPEFTQKIVAL